MIFSSVEQVSNLPAETGWKPVLHKPRVKNRCRIPKFADWGYATTDGLIVNAEDVPRGNAMRR
jgi:hypothetical protein